MIQFARPVYFGPKAAGGRDLWGKEPSTMGATGAGYGTGRGSCPLAGAITIAELENVLAMLDEARKFRL